MPILYHGSPHRFDSFSTDHIGRGEGFQTFGWGLYFASREEIADWYRAKLSPVPTFRYKNLVYDRKQTERFRWFGMTRNGLDLGDAISSTVKKIIQYHPRRDDLEKIESGWGYWLVQYMIGRILDGTEDTKSIGDSFVPEHLYDDERDDYELFLSIVVRECSKIVRDFPTQKGFVYEIEIPDSHFADWDKTGTAQNSAVRYALDKIDPDLDLTKPFAQLYQQISKKFASDKAASLALHHWGVSGIQYANGATRNSHDEQDHNYVIFSASSITIRKSKAY